MKKLILVMLALLIAGAVRVQTNIQKAKVMKLYTGIATNKFEETKVFYQRVLGFQILYENEFFVLMHMPGKQGEISFLKADHASQQPIFKPAYGGKGMYLTIEVPDVDKQLDRIKSMGIPVEVEIRDEPWGERHFAFYDPNGIGIDIVTYSEPQKN